MPQVPIMNIERLWPSSTNDVRSPFYDQSGAQMKPIAKLHLMRQRLYEKSCSEEESKTESAGLLFRFFFIYVLINELFYLLYTL